MSEVTIVSNNGQQATANFDTRKIFVWDNRFQDETYNNSDLYDPYTLLPGTLMGRIHATGVVVPLESGASDGSQLPIGILAGPGVAVDEGEDQEISMCVGGDVVEAMVLLQGSDTLDTVVSSRRLRDWIQLMNIKLVGGTEMSNTDNQ